MLLKPLLPALSWKAPMVFWGGEMFDTKDGAVGQFMATTLCWINFTYLTYTPISVKQKSSLPTDKYFSF